MAEPIGGQVCKVWINGVPVECVNLVITHREPPWGAGTPFVLPAGGVIHAKVIWDKLPWFGRIIAENDYVMRYAAELCRLFSAQDDRPLLTVGPGATHAWTRPWTDPHVADVLDDVVAELADRRWSAFVARTFAGRPGFRFADLMDPTRN